MSTRDVRGGSTTVPIPEPDRNGRDPDVEGFLALLAARRAPRTVEAYRRDLADFHGSSRSQRRPTRAR